jgi:Tol biopolymer transport system component
MVQNKKKPSNLLLAAVVFVISVVFITAGYFQSVQAAFPGVNGKIVFTSDRDGNHEIYIMNVDGTDPVNLTNNPASDFEPEWSPDGTKILFRSTRDGDAMYTMNSDGSEVERITNTTGEAIHATFSPDGTKIVFAGNIESANRQIYTMNLDGSGLARLTNNSAVEVWPNWSPDGTKIVFAGDQGLGSPSREIYTMNADGSNVVRLTNDVVGDQQPSWSPDGSKLLFYKGGEVHTMNTDGTNPTPVTSAAAIEVDPSWSPDGQKLIFQSNAGGDYEIVISDTDGSNQVTLTNNAFNDQNPNIQPLITPTVTNDSNVTTTAGKPVTIDVLSNDTDPYDSFDPSSITITSAPLNGTTSINTTTGEITYTPNTNFTGNDTFTYQVCSSYSELCETATVSITVTPGLPKTGDGSGSDNMVWILLSIGAVSGLTAFGIKLTKQREYIKK